MEWMNADDRLARSYSFKYDGLNRLTDATYDDAGGGKNHYNETVSYNANGSPVTIRRTGRNDSGNSTAIDDLKLYYIGPRLNIVTDKGEACTYPGATDFKDGASTSRKYTYNACGALTSDANKGIASIGYGYWGTLSDIQFTNGCQTQYVYDANGTKLKRIHITAVDNIVVPLRTTMELTDDQVLASDTTEYFGDLIFENGRLDKILFSGGYVSCSDNTPEHFTFHYYVKDHLGNNRAVVSESGAIEQSTHYYPFGNSFADAGTNPSLQQYKYNGKELDRMHGLDRYDYGARNYDPVILLWDRMDQLCEDYYPVSPYVYCANNPVSNIDSDGRKIVNARGNVLVSIVNGDIQYSKYATDDTRRIVRSMSLTNTGTSQLNKLINSSTKIQIHLLSKSKIEGREYTYGETEQGNYNEADDYGKYPENNRIRLKSATIRIYLGTIKESIKEGSKLKYEGMTEDEALGSVLSHEAVHCTDINEIDADLKYESKHGRHQRPNREDKTKEIEDKIKEELKRLCGM